MTDEPAELPELTDASGLRIKAEALLDVVRLTGLRAEDAAGQLLAVARIIDHLVQVAKELNGEETPAETLAKMIEAHRDAKYHGGRVTDPLDLTLYGGAVWFRTWQDHVGDPEAPVEE